MIQAGNRQWAEQNGKPPETVPTAADISPFIRNGFSECKCPRGGKYIIHPVGQEPECTVHGAASTFRKD
jgi:hypothetical protein